jgi:LPXTG-motif cell wall-anchored protein
VAQAPTAESAPLAPVSEHRKLARTGLDPAVIALLGALCLGGGAFLFRRAMAR